MNMNKLNKLSLALALVSGIILGAGCQKNEEVPAENGDSSASTNAVNQVEPSNEAQDASTQDNAAAKPDTNAKNEATTKVSVSPPPMPPMPPALPKLSDVSQNVSKSFEVVDVSAKDAAELILNNNDLIILDIRTPGEFNQGMIPSAVNIDFQSPKFASNVQKLSRDKDYLVHCRSGGRSTKSLELFKALGFKKIYHLDGGFLDWEKEGLETAKPQ